MQLLDRVREAEARAAQWLERAAERARELARERERRAEALRELLRAEAEAQARLIIALGRKRAAEEAEAIIREAKDKVKEIESRRAELVQEGAKILAALVLGEELK